jgi:hypothetical protein
MLTDFLVRLAGGMALALLLLSPGSTAQPTEGRKPVANANFFRTQLLVILGLSIGAVLWLWPQMELISTCLLAAAVCSAFGSVTWSLERSPGGVTLLVLTALAVGGALWLREDGAARFAGAASSALLLGAATSAMLMGHNYLVAPNLTMTPLYRLLGMLAAALVLRAGVEAAALLLWTREHGLDTLTGDAVLWLPVRWLVGLVGPAVLAWMAWDTARIRSTQSATGILYVVVIFCFLGEVTAQLLRPSGLSL